MQKLVWAVVLLILATATWRYRDRLAEWGAPPPPRKSIVFDNGSVRDADAASPPASQAPARFLPQGVMRKCMRGTETQYTDLGCPPGYKEKPVDGSRMTVIPGSAVPPATSTAAAGSSHPQKTLRDALDLSGDEHLREKIIERAVAKEAK